MTAGHETRIRLLNWVKGQAAAEGLAAQILISQNYKSVDPSHPLGGPDGLKDLICVRDSLRWIGAAYFPNGQQPFRVIMEKFKHDFAGVAKNDVDGIAFVTNQEIKLDERRKLGTVAGGKGVDIFHLERVTAILNSPACYGTRLEYLDIEMSKEDQLSFFATQAAILEQILKLLENPNLSKVAMSEELENLRRQLVPFFGASDMVSTVQELLWKASGERRTLIIDQLRDLSQQLEGLERSLPSVTEKLQNFVSIIKQLTPDNSPFGSLKAMSGWSSTVDLRTSLEDLRKYENTLDRVLVKLERLRKLQAEGRQHNPEDNV